MEHDVILAERLAAELVERFGATVHMAKDQVQALAFVETCKLDGVFVALDHASIESDVFIRLVRSSRGNKQVPIVVLTPNEELKPLAHACRAGADHFLVKPLIRPQLHRLMRTIYQRMVESRRLYQRALVDFPVLCASRSGREVGASVNLSASGMLLALKSDLQPRDKVELTFPFNREPAEPFVLLGRVSRTEHDGRVAVAFADIPPDQLTRLKVWVEMALFSDPEKLN